MKNIMLTEDHVEYMKEKGATLTQIILAQGASFDKKQFHEIEEGIAYGININSYVDSDIPWENMKEIRFGLMEGVPEEALNAFANSPYDVLKKVRQVLQSERLTYDEVKDCKTVEEVEEKLNPISGTTEVDDDTEVTEVAHQMRRVMDSVVEEYLYQSETALEEKIDVLLEEVASLRRELKELGNNIRTHVIKLR